jgi:hypothetical protein
MSRLVLALYFISIVVLPWTWFPPFPWLHEHAQWSDAVFAAAAISWLIERWGFRNWPRLEPFHLGLACYFLFACLSLLFASPSPASALPKLVGIGELCTLAFITSDLASRPGVSRGIGRAIAVSALVMAAAAAVGLVLFYVGIGSQLIGIYGELEPSEWYARVQAGTHNPNLLASFCIFAAAVVARRDSELPVGLRRITLAALWITVLVTFSRGILGFALAAAIRNATTPWRRRIAVSAAVVFLLLIVSATFWKPNLDPTHPFDIHVEQVASTRFQAATSSLISLATHPVFGTGLGTHPGAARGLPFDAHLTPVNIAGTLGLPALIAFAFLIAALWKRRSRPTDLAIWGGLAGLALDGLAQDVEDFRHVWVMIGLADCASQTDRSNRETAKDTSVRSLR